MRRRMLFVGLGVLAIGAWTAAPAFAAGDAQAGAKLFASHHCATCHGQGGKGDGKAAQMMKLHLADWTNKADMAKMTDQELTELIEKGGKALGKSPKMPAYGSKLDAQQVGDLVAYIRSLAH